MNNFKADLSKLKPSLEVDKDLKISELEKENAYLLIQLNKYKKIIATNKPVSSMKKSEKKGAIEQLQAKIKQLKSSHNYEKEKLLLGLRNAKEKMHQHAQRENFITKHFILVAGKEKFLEVINRLDNPDRRSKILIKEKREKFLASEKYTNENS